MATKPEVAEKLIGSLSLLPRYLHFRVSGICSGMSHHLRASTNRFFVNGKSSRTGKNALDCGMLLLERTLKR